MGKFYIPQLVRLERLPIIIYPCEGIEQLLDRKDPTAISRHIKELYKKSRGFPNGEFNIDIQFNIDILWEDNKDLMTDVWTFHQLDSWGSGALTSEYTFRGVKRETAMGTSAEFGHSMLGREAEHRLWTCKGDFKKYLATRPPLHPETTNHKNYYII